MERGIQGQAPVPDEVAQAAARMAAFPAPWALCGGWSLDAWIGRQTRDHLDVDLAVFTEDQLALRDVFASGWLLNGHDDTDQESRTPWNGRLLDVPGHVHAYADGFNLDIQLNWRDGDNLVLNEAPRIVLPLSVAYRPSPWLDSTLAPEATLYFKSIGSMNPKDEDDFGLFLPILTPAQRDWLMTALSDVRPGHPWIDRLRDSAPSN